MEFHWSGEFCALLTALIWAFALILFRQSGETISPLALNLFKNTVGITCLTITSLVLWCFGIYPAADWHASMWDVISLVVSGVIGIAIADTLFLRALYLCGVSLISIVDCSYAPFVLLFACLQLGEIPSVAQWIGTAMVLGGVLISSRHAPPRDRTRRQIATGAALGTIAMAFMVVSIVAIKPILSHTSLIGVALVRLLAGTVPLAVVGSLTASRKNFWGVFRPSTAWKTALPASFLGTYVSVILWIAGFKYTQQAGVAGILNQTSVIFATILAVVFLKESMTLRKGVAIALAFGGVLIVMMNIPVPMVVE